MPWPPSRRISLWRIDHPSLSTPQKRAEHRVVVQQAHMCTYVGTYTIRGADGFPLGIVKLGCFWPSKIFRRIKQLLRPAFFLTLAILAAKASPLERARDMEIEEI